MPLVADYIAVVLRESWRRIWISRKSWCQCPDRVRQLVEQTVDVQQALLRAQGVQEQARRTLAVTERLMESPEARMRASRAQGPNVLRGHNLWVTRTSAWSARVRASCASPEASKARSCDRSRPCDTICFQTIHCYSVPECLGHQRCDRQHGLICVKCHCLYGQHGLVPVIKKKCTRHSCILLCSCPLLHCASTSVCTFHVHERRRVDLWG